MVTILNSSKKNVINAPPSSTIKPSLKQLQNVQRDRIASDRIISGYNTPGKFGRDESKLRKTYKHHDIGKFHKMLKQLNIKKEDLTDKLLAIDTDIRRMGEELLIKDKGGDYYLRVEQKLIKCKYIRNNLKKKLGGIEEIIGMINQKLEVIDDNKNLDRRG